MAHHLDCTIVYVVQVVERSLGFDQIKPDLRNRGPHIEVADEDELPPGADLAKDLVRTSAGSLVNCRLGEHRAASCGPDWAFGWSSVPDLHHLDGAETLLAIHYSKSCPVGGFQGEG
jgi:hypothetical protein